MKRMRINRTFFNLDQEKLAPFVANLLQRCNEEPAFEAVRERLDAVQAAFDAFDVRLQEAVNGGRDRVTLKNLAKEALIDKLDRLIAGIELADLPEAVFAGTGLELNPVKRTRTDVPLEKPVILSVAALGDGTVQVHYQISQRRAVHTNVFEWSDDGGSTWHNGHHDRSQRTRIGGLPVHRQALVRVHSLGARGRRSPWSEPVAVFVL